MVQLCQKFASENNLKFSTNSNPTKSKTKCIHFSKQRMDLAKIELNGDYLPWVDSAKHVGNTLERDNSFSRDIALKRGDFIGRVHSIMQEVYFANPLVKMKMMRIYTTSFYGSSLWNIFDGSCQKLFTAWNTSVRMAFGVPRETHRYLLESISECVHPQQMLVKRFLKFHKTLQQSRKKSMRLLSMLSEGNLMTTYGQNLWKISHKCKEDIKMLTSRNVGDKFKYAPIPDEEMWKIDVIKEMLELKWNESEIDNFEVENNDLDLMIRFLCTS